ncbi:MAG TPA: arylsulfatase [Chitinophagaceae bacterium]
MLLKRLSFLLLFLLPVFVVRAQSQPGEAGKPAPNIIFILADDMGYGEPGCYGQQKMHTPNIDLLAKAGMRFTQFYAGTTVCAPSRASLLTGLHTGHTAVRGNQGVKPEGQFPLPASTITIADVLQKNGYETGAFGKWGLGYPASSGEPLRQGFTDFFGYNCQTLAHNYYPDHLWQNEQRLELPGNLQSDSVYSGDLIHQRAMQFLRQKHTQPFFLFLPYTLPHAELYGPRDSIYNYYRRMFKDEKAGTPSGKKEDYRFEPYPHAAYAAMITRLDHYVGDVMKAVKEQGLTDNTIIIFSSDNGPHKEGGADPVFFNSSGGLRGIKRDLYEGGIRVPFIAVWKGRITAGSSSGYPGTFWDLFPTFEEIAHIPVSTGIDGISFLPVLLGKPQPHKHEYLYWEFHESGGRQAVRWGNWKGVRLNVSTEAHPATELYDLAQDPREEHNIAAQHPDMVKQIDRMIRESHVSDKNWPLLLSEIPR